MQSLIEQVRKCFLDAIRSVNPPGRWKVMVVDDHSKRLLGAVLKDNDVLQENITLIEGINTHRGEQSLEAMYLLMPTSQNVERIIADFAGPRKRYAAAHLFFIDGLPEPLLNLLVNSPAEPHLRALQDLYVNFAALEQRVFSIRSPSIFFSMYAPHKEVPATTFTPRKAEVAQMSPMQVAVKGVRDRLDNDIRFMAKSILNVCILNNENPLIRYYLPSHHPPLGPLANPPEAAPVPTQAEGSSRWRSAMATNMRSSSGTSENDEHISKRLAYLVQQELDEYRKANHDFPKVIPGETNRPRGVLFITDRAMDPVAPLMHEFTYQAMATDLLPIEGGTRYRYKFENSRGIREEKTAVLGETDQIWTATRHMHLLAANEKLKEDFNKFLEDNAVFRGGDQSLNGVKDMLAGLPQYQETWEKFSLHLNMAGECNSMFDQNNLSGVADVEQNCAMGQTAEGKVPKSVIEDLVLLLENKNLTSTDKARLIALYIMYRDGVSDEDRRRLFQHAKLSTMDQDAVNGLTYLGSRVMRTPADRDIKRKLKQKAAAQYDYDQSRYQPVLQTVLEDHFSGKLDPSVFPYVKDAPPAAPPLGSSLGSFRSSPQPSSPASAPTSLRSQKPSWHKAPRAGGGEALKQRVFVFIAGGMTYSEMRTVYTASNTLNKDIYIGSTHQLTPSRFVGDLRAIAMDGVGSSAIPDGLPKPSEREKPYQEYYDQRYWIQEAPPPPKPAPSPAPAHAAPAQQQQRLAPPRGPTHQSSSSSLSGSGEKLKKDKEKKKRGLFHF